MCISIKRFESVCHEHSELTWCGISQPVSLPKESMDTKYSKLVIAVKPFIEAAMYIPKGTPPTEDIACIPRSSFCVGDFYGLLAALVKDQR